MVKAATPTQDQNQTVLVGRYWFQLFVVSSGMFVLLVVAGPLGWHRRWQPPQESSSEYLHTWKLMRPTRGPTRFPQLSACGFPHWHRAFHRTRASPGTIAQYIACTENRKVRPRAGNRYWAPQYWVGASRQ